MCGRYYWEGIEPNAFAGWVHPVTARGFTALDIGCNAHQVERTYRDVRLLGTGQLLSEIAYASGFRD
jgi:AraC family transcriptional regulator, positive regulator of tynA and feaB